MLIEIFRKNKLSRAAAPFNQCNQSFKCIQLANIDLGVSAATSSSLDLPDSHTPKTAKAIPLPPQNVAQLKREERRGGGKDVCWIILLGGGVHVIMSDVYFFFFAAGLAWLTVFCTSARSISLSARGIKRGKERGVFSRKCMVPGHTPICGWYGNASPYLQYYSRHGAVLTLSRCLSDFLTYTPPCIVRYKLGGDCSL